MSLFVDTGAFVARYCSDDDMHNKAVTGWKKMAKERLVTSNLVITETITLLAKRTSPEFAADTADLIFLSEQLKIVYANRDDELQALQFIRKFSDQKISFTDSVSFVIMKNAGIAKAFSFDKHFKVVGFQLVGN